MNDGYQIREALPHELELLRQLEQKVVDAERPYNVEIKEDDAIYYDLDHLLKSKFAKVLVVEYNSQIIGTGYAQIRDSKTSLSHEKHAYLGFMYVDDQHRGMGINKAIIDNLMQWSKLMGVYHLYLDVYAENESALKAYQKAGFEPSMIEMKLTVK